MSWNDRYLAGEFPWDLGRPNPLVLEMAEAALCDPPTGPSRVFVPGCGRGWEVEALAAHGHRVVGLDIAPAALALAQTRIDADALPGSVELVVGDVLVGDGPPDGGEGFDGWAEHTCFCALDPVKWPAYVEAAWRRLRPGGALFGAFLHFEGGGPPFGTNPTQVRALFEPRFEIERLEPAADFERAGVPQLAAIFRRR